MKNSNIKDAGSVTRYYIDRFMVILKASIVKDLPETKEEFEEMDRKVNQVLTHLSQDVDLLGEDFCIEKGIELKQWWEDHIKYRHW